MPNPLIPELDGRRLTVDAVLRNPRLITARIAELAGNQILLDKFFTATGEPVEGGGLLYSVVKASDFYTDNDVETRSPGGEYRVVEGVQPEPKLALVEDWGGKFNVLDEQRTRNDASYVDNQVTQLTNTIVRKLNDAALAALNAGLGSENVFAGHNWSTVITAGPSDGLTPNDQQPTADFADAQMTADLQELGITHDLLVLHPNEARALKVAYGKDLADVLTSNGLEMFSCPRVKPGEGYAAAKGKAGTVGFETPLTIETWDERGTRSTWVQAYAVPAFAVERPYAVKKLTGLAG